MLIVVMVELQYRVVNCLLVFLEEGPLSGDRGATDWIDVGNDRDSHEWRPAKEIEEEVYRNRQAY